MRLPTTTKPPSPPLFFVSPPPPSRLPLSPRRPQPPAVPRERRGGHPLPDGGRDGGHDGAAGLAGGPRRDALLPGDHRHAGRQPGAQPGHHRHLQHAAAVEAAAAAAATANAKVQRAVRAGLIYFCSSSMGI